MKRKRYSVEQIVAVLKQAELGLSVTDLTRQIGISEQSYYRRRKEYGGLKVDQAKRLKMLERESGQPDPGDPLTARVPWSMRPNRSPPVILTCVALPNRVSQTVIQSA
jgi:putative transposase